MELKVVCQCGQKYAFDVEPVGGRMPVSVSCPECQTDGTPAANMQLAQLLGSSAPPPRFVAPPPVAPAPAAAPPPPIAPASGGLRINRAHEEATAAPTAAHESVAMAVPPPIGGLKPVANKSKPKVEGEYSLVRGIMGAIAGSAIGSGLLVAFWIWAGFRFPLSGIAVGVAAGYMARWLARGTDMTLGVITAGIAVASVTGTFIWMYGEFPIFNIISVIVCASVAFRLTSE